MTHPEDQPGRYRPDNAPLIPTALSPELANFLARAGDYACISHGTDQGTAYLIKAPDQELSTLRGTIPVELRHELHGHPAAPVIRTVLSLYDRPRYPLKVESFINIAEADQRADFAALADQERLLVLVFDREVRHRLTKVVPYPDRSDIPVILARAQALLASIPASQFDFDKAKADILRTTTL